MGILSGVSSCILILPRGVTRLSGLEIDADKNWNGKAIYNLKELDAGMARGDVVTHNGARIAKLSAGSIGNELTSGGPDHNISWAPPPGG